MSASFVWPNILEYILDPSFSPGLPIMLKHILSLLVKFGDEITHFSIEKSTSRNMIYTKD